MTDPTPTQNPPVDFASLPPVPERRAASVEWELAWANLFGGRALFVSLVTWVSVVGVTIGVAALVAVLAVMTGFEEDLREKILGANAHIVVMSFEGPWKLDDSLLAAAEAVPGVKAVAPFVYGEGIVRSRGGMSGAIVKGVDLQRTPQVAKIREQITHGLSGELSTDAERALTFAQLEADIPGNRPGDEDAHPGILVGVQLQQALQVQPGDTVQLINPVGNTVGILGPLSPKVRLYRVAGIFDSGMFEYDTKWVYTSTTEAQAFTGQGERVTGLEVKVDDIDAVDTIGPALNAALGYPRFSKHWRDMNSALFDALTLEKVVMGLILGLVTLIAGMLIISNLFMMVLTKRREIAILMSIGAAPQTILRAFLWTGGAIGLVGTLAGTVLGLLICMGLDTYEYGLDTDVYLVSTLPVVVQPLDVLLIASASLVACLVAALYPAWRASTLHPVEGLRTE